MKGRQSVDSLTTITSGQLEEAMKVDDQTNLFDKAAEELENECKGSFEAKCKDYVLEGKEIQDSKDRISEMALRMLAMEERVKKNLDASVAGDQKATDELTQFFKEEGFNEEDIDKIIKNKEKVKIATKQIIKNYEQRRQAVINNLQNKLDKMVPKDDTDQEKLSIIKQVSQELMDRPKHYQQLLHYSNIVSSYLSTTSGSDDATNGDQSSGQTLQVDDANNANRYTTAASKELGSLGQDYQDSQDDLAKKFDVEADDNPDTGEESLISIGLDTINSFLYKEVTE